MSPRAWQIFNPKNSTHRKKFSGAIQYFMSLPDRFTHYPGQDKDPRKASFSAKLQEFMTADELPTSVLEIMSRFMTLSYYDNAYEQIFDVIDFTGYPRNGFTIYNVEHGITFQQVRTGDKIRYHGLEGEKAYVYFARYGGGLEIDQTLLDDREYYQVEEGLRAIRNAAFSQRASVFNALIEAVPASQNLAWQAPLPAGVANTDPTYTANRDAQTINKAVLNIISDCKNKYPVTPATTFAIYTPIELVQRIQMALKLRLQAFEGSEKGVGFNLVVVPTMSLTSSDYYYVVLPKNKLKAGYRMALKVFEGFDIDTYSRKTPGWMRFGGAVGDIEQVQRCLLS